VQTPDYINYPLQSTNASRQSFMPRENHRISITLAVTVLGASLVAYLWYSAVQVNDPTSQEYAVYRALLPHIAEGSKKRIVAQKRTSALSLPAYDSTPPTPVELRITNVEDASFPDFEDYCGRCAKDFLKKNLKAWPLPPTLDYSSVPRGALRGDDSILVTLSRVGFNAWHTRAVVTFSADCSDAASSTMCLELGQAYLKRKDDAWIVERVSGNVF
jgi:hypothetical protein